MMDKAEKAFRHLREIWAFEHLIQFAPERELEDDEAEACRDNHNNEIMMIYDRDTEAILRGENRPIAPTCAAEIDNRPLDC